MLDSRTSLEKALLNFPKWMDIRKRNSTSNGGKLLDSIIKEIDDIQSAINEYRKDFFIISYIGKEDAIIDYLYIANIGKVDIDKLKVLSHKDDLIFDLKEFLTSDKKCICYANESLLFNPRYFQDFNNKIEYAVSDYQYSSIAELTHIWNVIDEFALFSGISRQDTETNKQLLERTLLVYKNKPNSSNDGIKNAIFNILSSKTNISKDEIIIEPPKYENLFKVASSGDKVIDILSNINKDTFGEKIWDFNKWQHDFKKLDYIYPEWDMEPNSIQDGVGYNDALKTTLISEINNNELTDVKINLYQKDIYRINEFIRKNRKNFDIDLKLTKYKNVLKPTKVNYKIVASSVKKIEQPIYIDSYKLIDGEKKFYIDDIIQNSNEVKDIIINRNKLVDGNKYKLKFYPSSPYSKMNIYKCNINNNSILKEIGPYKIIDGVLTNTNVKLHAKTISDVYNYSNIVNYANGMTLENASVNGNIGIDISGMQGQYFKISHSCKETSVTRDASIVKFDNNKFEIDNNDFIVSKTGNTDGTIEIDLECSQFFMEMTEGNCIVSKTIDGETMPSEIWFDAKNIQLNFDKKKNVKILITKLNNSQQLKIRNIRYAKYDIVSKLKHGTFMNTPSGQIIPLGYENNFVNIEIKTYTGFAPEIEFIHIGSDLSNAVYETEILTANNSVLDIESNCRVELIETDSAGNILNTNSNYVSKNIYDNKTTSPVFVQIDVSSFINILSSYPTIDKFSYNGKMSSFIKILPGEKFDAISVSGKSLEQTARYDIFKELKQSSNELYASQALKGIISKDQNDEKLIKLDKKSISKVHSNVYKVIGMSEDIQSVFVTSKDKNIENITDTFDKEFEYVYFTINNEKTHIAYNSIDMIRPDASGINIINLFNPFINDNELYSYQIEQPIEQKDFVSVLFEKKEKAQWSLGSKTLSINITHSEESSNYESESRKIKKTFMLSNNIDMDRYIIIDNKTLDLAEYILTPPIDMNISYQRKRSAPENIIAENDGFNKLKYSNVSSIVYIKDFDNSIIDKNKYSLLNKEGIIQWNDSTIAGKELIIEYDYDVPVSLIFKSYDSLYELIGYNIEAYKYKDSINYTEINTEVQITIDDMNKLSLADRMILSCSNPNFISAINNNILSVSKIKDDNNIIVKSGFYYQDGVENYFFANKNETVFEKLGNIDLIDTERIGNSVEFSESSTNLIPESSMYKKRVAKTMYVDFNEISINGSSTLNGITACDAFNYWKTFEMNISFVSGLNDIATKFSPLTSDSYAIMDITEYIKEKSILSLYKKGNIKVYVSKEIKYKNMSYNKSILTNCAEEIQKYKDYYSYIFNNYEEDTKYYLIVVGEGIIDDIIISNEDMESVTKMHTKNITDLGFNIIEDSSQLATHKLLFDKEHNMLDKLEITDNKEIITSSTADWGLTKIYEAKGKFEQCNIKHIDIVKNMFLRTTNRFGYIETIPQYIRNTKSIKSLVVKINNILIDSMKGFKVELLTSRNIGGPYSIAGSVLNNNILSVGGNKLFNYIKLNVEMPPNKTIENIEIFLDYIEVDGDIIRINQNTSGALETKVYDLGHIANYKVKKVNIDEYAQFDDIEIYARSYRYSENNAVWTEWKKLTLNDSGEVIKDISFNQYRFMQFKVNINNGNSSIKIDSFEIEVI